MAISNDANQYLVFTLGQERYALRVANVREVLESAHITRLPVSEYYLKGVINLRGSVVPVIDLALRLGVGATHEQGEASVIVLAGEVDGTTRLLGALADSVQAVVEFDDSAIEATPHFGGIVATNLVSGIAKREGDFYIILDGEGLFAEESDDLGEPATEA